MRYFKCNESTGEYIPHIWVNDSIPDCLAGQDEQHFFEIRSNYSNVNDSCLEKHMFPCFPGDTRCFPIYKICLYQLYENMGPGYLQTCRNGWHLANCTDHVCHHYSKCRAYYCIPHNYLCNGRQDCPLADDEEGCVNRTCAGLFRCLSTEICLHGENICNDLPECPGGEDELFCELSECPPSCNCLLTAMTCINITSLSQIFTHLVPCPG